MKRQYFTPYILMSNYMASPAPLAFFSAATATAAAIGALVGAVGTKAAIRATPDDMRNAQLQAVLD